MKPSPLNTRFAQHYPHIAPLRPPFAWRRWCFALVVAVLSAAMMLAIALWLRP